MRNLKKIGAILLGTMMIIIPSTTVNASAGITLELNNMLTKVTKVYGIHEEDYVTAWVEDSAELRKTPFEEEEIIETLEMGSELKVYSYDDYWYYVMCDDGVKFVRTDQVVTESQIIRLPDNIRDFFARCVFAEAGNQGLIGQRWVAAVILNRVDSESWPDTIEGVISQKSQFSVYPNHMYRHEPTDETYLAVDLECTKRINNEAIYFRTKHPHSQSKFIAQIGDHYFCRQ